VVDERALTVTEAMSAAKQALENVRVRVVGEVSEFNDKPGYKAAYFTVSDGSAAMPCLMWRDQYVASGVELRCGTLVELTGSFSAYIAKGRMQFTVRTLSLAGEGNLRLEVAKLARRLELEGLMSAARKRVVPRYPQRIAVVTSPRGKAIHDVMNTLRRRYPLAELLVAGVPVEGDEAPAAIVAGLERASDSGADVVLLVRGGGSYEDLMPFNAEVVARAVVASGIPVVTGIGHEPDNSIADMVADVRASTPTAAAEAVAPSCTEVASALAREQRALGQALQARVRLATHRVALLAEREVLRDPRSVLGPAAQAIDGTGDRLRRALPARLERDSQRLAFTHDRMLRVGRAVLETSRSGIAIASARLGDLSPLGILSRGYAVCFAEDGTSVLKSIGDVSTGDVVEVRVSDGRIAAEVRGVTTLEER
jgi:exodeoxyribonuclease VII large subunit